MNVHVIFVCAAGDFMTDCQRCEEEALARQLQGEALWRAPSVNKVSTAFEGFWKEKTWKT
jgi:hypothetical protein